MVNGKMTIPTKELQNGNKANYTHFLALRQPFSCPQFEKFIIFLKKKGEVPVETGTIPPEEEKRKQNRPGSLKLPERWI